SSSLPRGVFVFLLVEEGALELIGRATGGRISIHEQKSLPGIGCINRLNSSIENLRQLAKPYQHSPRSSTALLSCSALAKGLNSHRQSQPCPTSRLFFGFSHLGSGITENIRSAIHRYRFR